MIFLGAGYTGRYFGMRVARGESPFDSVLLCRRNIEEVNESERTHYHSCDLQNSDSWDAILEMMGNDSVVIQSVPPQENLVELEQRTVELAHRANARRLVYLSSTGVYGKGEGEWVTEENETNPLMDRGKARLRAEARLRKACNEYQVNCSILRVAGIYGSDRGLFHRIRYQGYRLPEGQRGYVSRIHVEDLVTAIVLAANSSIKFSIYNVADDLPEESFVLFETLVKKLNVLGVELPPNALSGLPRKRFGANRKISNSLIKKELGLHLRFPTWGEGLAEFLRAST